jgi:hypothetical protein
MRPILCLAAIAALSACAALPRETAAPEVVARWDHRPEAAAWNAAALRALHGPGAALLALEPADAQEFCPGYDAARPEGRAAFWVALLSALARHESGHRPEAAGGGGRYHGLLQISPATARFHGCEMAAPQGLFDGATNLACAVRIAARAVRRDGVVATGRGGMAADWPPLRDPATRAEIAGFTRAIPACRA